MSTKQIALFLTAQLGNTKITALNKLYGFPDIWAFKYTCHRYMRIMVTLLMHCLYPPSFFIKCRFKHQKQ